MAKQHTHESTRSIPSVNRRSSNVESQEESSEQSSERQLIAIKIVDGNKRVVKTFVERKDLIVS